MNRTKTVGTGGLSDAVVMIDTNERKIDRIKTLLSCKKDMKKFLHEKEDLLLAVHNSPRIPLENLVSFCHHVTLTSHAPNGWREGTGQPLVGSHPPMPLFEEMRAGFLTMFHAELASGNGHVGGEGTREEDGEFLIGKRKADPHPELPPSKYPAASNEGVISSIPIGITSTPKIPRQVDVSFSESEEDDDDNGEVALSRNPTAEVRPVHDAVSAPAPSPAPAFPPVVPTSTTKKIPRNIEVSFSDSDDDDEEEDDDS